MRRFVSIPAACLGLSLAAGGCRPEGDTTPPPSEAPDDEHMEDEPPPAEDDDPPNMCEVPRSRYVGS